MRVDAFLFNPLPLPEFDISNGALASIHRASGASDLIPLTAAIYLKSVQIKVVCYQPVHRRGAE
jgi:hypothetical protein